MDTVERIEMIMRQTDYDKVTAEQKLEQHKNNVMDVIREYLTEGKPINNLQKNNWLTFNCYGLNNFEDIWNLLR